jgi:polysaccharide export outer membrane protein
VTVGQDGTVVLPLVGRVTAAGRTLTQLQDDLRTRLVSGGYFVRPEVSVTLVTAASRYATILGEVSAPGLVPLDRDYHLSEVVARAGGVKGLGVDRIRLTRASGETQDYSLRAMATSGGAADPVVAAGDKVYVAPADVFYIYGQVSAPGTYPIDAGMTVRQALARGGGLTALGSIKKVKLNRGNSEIKVALDEKIQPGDTITVGERFF